MRIIGAYLLAVLGGNDAPDAAAITKILDSVGATAPEDEVEQVVSKLKGKDIDQLIADGLAKMASVPSIGGGGGGGGGGAAAGGGGGAAAGGAAAPAAKEPEKEKEKEKSEESEADMGFSLFD